MMGSVLKDVGKRQLNNARKFHVNRAADLRLKVAPLTFIVEPARARLRAMLEGDGKPAPSSRR